jgi:phenylalanyl-tRNA synthetase beta chain
MRQTGTDGVVTSAATARAVKNSGWASYWLELLAPAEAPSYFPGRGVRVCMQRAPGADVSYTGAKPGDVVTVGSVGVLHPAVLKHFDLSYPASVVEINLEHFLFSKPPY